MLRNNARVALSLGRRSIRQAFRRPQFLAPLVVFPSLMLAVNTGGAAHATELPGFPHVHGFLDFELAGAMMQSTMLAGVGGGIALALDIEMGFIDRLFAAPISRVAIVVGRLAASATMGVLAGVWFIGGGLLFGAHIKGGVPGALVIVLLTCLSAVAFGAIGSALALRAGKASVVQGIFPLVFVILFLSSAFFPRELLLEPARTIAQYNPLSLIAEGLRGPVLGHVRAADVGRALGGIAIVGGIGTVFCAAGLRTRMKAG
jgi:ABC-2 type transport system permease protein